MYKNLKAKWPENDYRGNRVRLINQSLFDVNPFPVDIIYTDPPWNDGILAKFYNYAGAPPAPSFDKWITDFLQVLKRWCPRGWVFIDMGIPKTKFLWEKIKETGANIYIAGTSTYSGGIKYSFTGYSYDLTKKVEETGALGRDWQVSENLLTNISKPGDTLLDTCAGSGGFIKTGWKLGLNCVGIELIPEKYALMCDTINKLTPLQKS